jgi:hypothetical protein
MDRCRKQFASHCSKTKRCRGTRNVATILRYAGESSSGTDAGGYRIQTLNNVIPKNSTDPVFSSYIIAEQAVELEST